MKKRATIITIILCAVVLAIVIISIYKFRMTTNNNIKRLQALKDHSITKIMIGDEVLEVEVVNHSKSIRQGLSNRDEIGSDGMLFVMPNKRETAFWMKEMKFDLDFVWIADDRVVQVMVNIPAPPEPKNIGAVQIVTPKTASNLVLEMNAGEVDNRGIKPGDLVVVTADSERFLDKLFAGEYFN